MSDELNFEQVFADFPQVLFPYDKSLPVKGWLVQGPKQQVVFWHSQVSYESAEHRHPYGEWGIVITGWCEIITPEGRRPRCLFRRAMAAACTRVVPGGKLASNTSSACWPRANASRTRSSAVPRNCLATSAPRSRRGKRAMIVCYLTTLASAKRCRGVRTTPARPPARVFLASWPE